MVYKELVVAYLKNAQSRGYCTCHIWASPPRKNDDYGFNCHPSDQKTPNDSLLQKWYGSIVQTAKERGVVLSTTDFVTEFLAENANPLSIPYLEGQYWIEVAENLEEAAQGGQGDQVQRRVKTPKPETSTPPSIGDPLVQKLRETLEPIKRSFFVVKLKQKLNEQESAAGTGTNSARKIAPPMERDGGQPDAMQANTLEHNVPNDRAEDKRKTVSEEQVIAAPGTEQRIANDEAKGEQQDTPPCKGTLFDNRETFLEFCQRNYYQFNTWRRAIHSTGMVLYHMHNPGKPWFLPKCFFCGKGIVADDGFTCRTCVDWNVCEGCIIHGKDHKHELDAITEESMKRQDIEFSRKAGGAS